MRVGSYLRHRPRYVIRYKMQDEVFDIHCYEDSDHAGCLRTRMSTNGMNLFHGKHWIRGSSSTQSVIALSSGESEFYAIVKAASVLLGFISMAKDFGITYTGTIFTDATVRKGIAERRGVGRVRHLDTQYLWVQQKLYQKAFKIKKIKGTENPADLQTTYVGQAEIEKNMAKMNFVHLSGHSKMAKQSTA